MLNFTINEQQLSFFSDKFIKIWRQVHNLDFEIFVDFDYREPNFLNLDISYLRYGITTAQSLKNAPKETEDNLR